MAKKTTVIIEENTEEVENNYRQNIRANIDKTNDKIMNIVSEYITDGYQETLAKLLVYIGAERAAQTIAGLPDSIRENVEARYKSMSDKKTADPDIISAAGKVVKLSGFYGEDIVHDITENLDSSIPNRLTLEECQAYFDTNPLITFNAEMHLIKFEDILLMGDRDIQRLLREVDSPEICRALKGADDEIRDKIFRNMSHRAANVVRADMEYMGPIRVADIRNAQAHIVSLMMRMESEGDIVISHNDEEFVH